MIIFSFYTQLFIIHTFLSIRFLLIIHLFSLDHILSLSLVTEHRHRRSSRNGMPPETFASARCISMHLGSTKLCDSSRNTNCSGDLCVIHDQQTTTLLTVHPLCVVSFWCFLPRTTLRGISLAPQGSWLDLLLLNRNRKVQGYVVKRN